jgi:putative acetyltransferase
MTGMPLSTLNVRLEQHADASPVRAVLARAFGGSAEADLVDRLRANGELVLALVAERANVGIEGYVAFPRLWVETASLRLAAVALAPLAVVPDIQGLGAGSTLVRRGIALLEQRGEQLVFVLGDPAYYARFGFDAAAAARFNSPYDGPHFMVLRLTPAAPRQGSVRYPFAFAELG